MSGNLRIVLIAPRNPNNIGAAARAMSNFGFFDLHVVNPYQVAFREARSAVGAASLLASAQEFTGVADAVADCSLVVGTTALGHRAMQHPLLRLDRGARRIRQRLLSGNIALLFGSEKFGLSNADLSHCHWLLHIPTREEHLSMNLGQAVAVCLYELARGGKPSPVLIPRGPATSTQCERLTLLLHDALHASGYLQEPGPAAEQKLRRLVRRLRLDQQDAELWLGMVRQILWKMKMPPKAG
ncbi:MAG: RNA methyltransferase [Acidobacteriaceae bacterium]